MPAHTRVSAVRPLVTSSSPTCGPTNSPCAAPPGVVGFCSAPTPDWTAGRWCGLSDWAGESAHRGWCPGFARWLRPAWRPSSLLRTLLSSTGWVYWTSITVPPVNSTLKCRPLLNRKTPTAKGQQGNRRGEFAIAHERDVFLKCSNSIRAVPLLNRQFGHAAALPYTRLTKPRDTITGEHRVRMPRQCTTAKPRTGPEPKSAGPGRQSGW